MENTQNNITRNELRKKRALRGIYAVKSSYHDDTHYLPFIILSYAERNNTYNILTVEYKGLTAYKIDEDYPEKSICELIEKGIINKIANSDDYRDNEEAMELIKQFAEANNQQED